MALEQEYDPLSQLMYCLEAPGTSRRWLQSPKMFFDFLKFEADLDHQVKYFVNKARQHPAWAQQKIYSVYFRKIMQ